MGFHIIPTLANTFSVSPQNYFFKRCSRKFQPKYYNRFVDDIVVIFEKPITATWCIYEIRNIRFSIETEKNGALFFRDFFFFISVYREETFSGVYTILPILFFLFCFNTSLVYHTPFFIGVFAYFWIFQSFTWNLKNLRKFFQKMLTYRNL